MGCLLHLLCPLDAGRTEWGPDALLASSRGSCPPKPLSPACAPTPPPLRPQTQCLGHGGGGGAGVYLVTWVRGGAGTALGRDPSLLHRRGAGLHKPRGLSHTGRLLLMGVGCRGVSRQRWPALRGTAQPAPRGAVLLRGVGEWGASGPPSTPPQSEVALQPGVSPSLVWAKGSAQAGRCRNRWAKCGHRHRLVTNSKRLGPGGGAVTPSSRCPIRTEA